MRIRLIGPIRPIGRGKKTEAARTLAFFLSLIFFFAFPALVLAKEKISLRVAPLSFDYSINPGEEKGGKIYVENVSNQDLEINVEFSDFFTDDNGNYVFPDEKDGATIERYKLFFMKDWFRTEKSELDLKKGQSELVNFSIRVPEEANLGGHYGAIFFRTGCRLEEDPNVVSSDKSRVCVSARPGVLFLVQVGGGAVKSARLKRTEIPGISFQNKESLNVELENTGNAHFKPEGSVLATSVTGKEIFRLDIKDRTLLPGASRSFSGVLEKKDLWGIYKIAGAVKDGDGEEVKFQKWTFLVPWKEALAVLALAGFWWWFLKRFRISRKRN